MSSITIRFAEEKDNDQIAALAKRCYQEGMVTISVNRFPVFNTLHRMLDPSAWHMVACKDNLIIGLLGVVHFNAMVLGKPMRIGYVLDLRVDKIYRSGLAAFKLVKTAVDHLYRSDVDMVIVNFLKDNKQPMVFTSGRGGLPAAHFLGENTVFNLLSLYKVKPDQRFRIEAPTENDIPAMVDLYEGYSENFKIVPEISEKRFKEYIGHIDGLALNNFLVARENGEIKAMLACWDEHNYKHYRVLKLNRSIAAVNIVLKMLSPVIKVPNPIRVNEPLKQLSLVYCSHNHCPEALESLFVHVNNKYRGAEYTLITLYSQGKDKVFNGMKRFHGISIQSEMYVFAKDTSVFEQLDKDSRPVMTDITMIL